jgi:short-subunit dehydrogenase
MAARLAGKCCLVTGAAQGIGRHIAAADEAKFMTGADIVIDGGMSL